MKKLHIIKIGGDVIDDPQLLSTFLKDFSALQGYRILVHGGGKLATNLADSLGIKQTLIDGRRITDAQTLNIAVMVYAGLINKTIVAKLQAVKCNALGFCGADGNLIKSKKRGKTGTDFGCVGDVLPGGVDVTYFEHLLLSGVVPVISPITHDGEGNLLNTNADSIATVIALAMNCLFDVRLTYCFKKKGVLRNTWDEESFIPLLNKQTYSELKAAGVISKGMIPKLDNAFQAAEEGIKKLVICHAADLTSIETQIRGTQLVTT